MFYEFNCEEHGNFEVHQSINDVHIAICPVCSKVSSRVFSPPMIMGDLPTILGKKAIESKVIMAAGG